MVIAKHIVGGILGLFLLGSGAGLFAQDLQAISIDSKMDTPKYTPSVTDVSLLLRERDSYQNIRRNIGRLKSTLQNKKRKPATVGDTAPFFVRNISTLNTWDTIVAECIYTSDNIALWVSVADNSFYADSLSFSQIADSLSQLLEVRSPSGSIDPAKGILEIDREYFGSPPDVDGDGILDILLLDVEDGFEETGGFVAGFFDPVDLIEHEFSNQRDLIYIDIFPTLFYRNELHIARGISTIAHELQHLIHANYETAERQYTFINEGLSEYAEVLSGFSPRNPESYYQQPNRALFSWNYDEPIPDYARSSLFFTYLVLRETLWVEV